ncbi:MAG: hypothetical protein Q9175_004755 [Cornicularia normoerica]
MRITKSVVFGLVSLVCTVTATKVAGKPVLAKRQELVTVTVVNGVPSKAAHIANLVARENVQGMLIPLTSRGPCLTANTAHQVHEARLARKFGGLLARHDTMTVTVTSIPEYCTAGPESFISTTVAGIPTILPMQVPQKAGVSGFSAALSQASAALSAVEQAQGGATGNLSVASSALSEASALSSMASSLLSEVMSEAISEASASSSSVAATAAPASAGSSPTVSATTTATSTSSETTTASTTTTGSQVVSEAGTAISTSVPITGAAPEYNISIWLVYSLLVGLAANAAFLI